MCYVDMRIRPVDIKEELKRLKMQQDAGKLGLSSLVGRLFSVEPKTRSNLQSRRPF